MNDNESYSEGSIIYFFPLLIQTVAVKDAQSILPTVNSLISLSGWQMIVASQDAHPKNHISFASTHNSELFQTIKVPHPTLNRDENPDGELVDQMLWPDHCLKGSRGYQLEKSVEQALEEKKEKRDCKIRYLEKVRLTLRMLDAGKRMKD